jgi:hypothetical protein
MQFHAFNAFAQRAITKSLVTLLVATGTWAAIGSGGAARADVSGATVTSTTSTSSPSTGGTTSSGPDLPGYWMATADGGVMSFGGVPVPGSINGAPLAAPIVDLAPTPDGKGYWLVAADGGIFAYGDAHFYGSTGGMRLFKPIVGMSSTPDGKGYWLVAADGGIFAYGDARFHGSTGGTRLFQPVVGMAASSDGKGYWLVAADGGIFAFGDAHFYGSTGGARLSRPMTGMAATPDGAGYFLVAADGGVFNYGDAHFRGSAGGSGLLRPVVALAVGPGVGSDVTPDPSSGEEPYPSGSVGYDISWPQCGSPLPGPPFTAAVVGVNNGSAFTSNPCLGDEARWAGSQLSLYINLNSPVGTTPASMSGPAGSCNAADLGCRSYNWGWNAAGASQGTAARTGARSDMWWLDVETGNFWTGDTNANALVIKGAIDELHSNQLTVAAYSTSFQWGRIAGGYRPGIPDWVATGVGLSNPSGWCSPDHGFTGGPTWLVQGGLNGLDGDYAC